MAGEGIVGGDAKLYYNTGTHALPTWVEITRAIDVNAPRTKNDVTYMARFSSFVKHAAGKKDVAIEFGYLHAKGADTVFDKLLADYAGDVVTEFTALDQGSAVSGAQGLRLYAQVFDISQVQPIEGAIEYSVALRHAEDALLTEPDWYEVA